MSKLIRKPVAEPEKVNPYAKFNLMRNPFPPEGVVRVNSDDPVENGTIFDPKIRAEILEDFKRKFIFPDHIGRINTMGFLWSPGSHENRGLGKTAFLRYFIQQINKDFGASLLGEEYKACVLYLYPREDIKRLNHLCLLALRKITEEENGKRSIFDNVLSIVRYRAIEEDFPHVIKKLDTEEKIEKLADDDFIKELEIDFEGLADKVTNIFTANGVRSEVAEQVSRVGLQAFLRPYFYFSARRLEKESVDLFFNDLVGMLLSAYFTHAYVFVDDLYNMFLKAYKRDIERFAESLNYWQFRSPDSLAVKKRFYSFVLTMHAKAQESLNPFWRQSGLSQFCPMDLRGTHALLVDTINAEEARKLISNYQNYRGTYTFRGKVYVGHRVEWKKAQEDPLSPFTTEAVDKLAELNGYHPRKMLNKEYGAYKVLEHAVSADIDKIDTDFIEKVFEEKPPPVEEEEGILEY